MPNQEEKFLGAFLREILVSGLKLRFYGKILVTGGAGFIGSNLCEHLVLNGYDVVCLDNFQLGT